MKLLKENRSLDSHLLKTLKTPEMRNALDTDDFKTVYDILARSDWHHVYQFTELMLELGDNPLDYLDYIPKYFLSHSDISEFTIPSHIKRIESCAFEGCWDLSNVDFSQCTNLISIKYSAFNQCNFTKVDLSNCTKLEIIEDRAFSSCSKLTTIILPDSLNYIGWRAFAGCNFKEINLPNGLLKIRDEAFASCNSLTNMTIPKSVTALGKRLFSDCRNLCKVRMPEKFKDKVAWSWGVPYWFEIEYY